MRSKTPSLAFGFLSFFLVLTLTSCDLILSSEIKGGTPFDWHFQGDLDGEAFSFPTGPGDVNYSVSSVAGQFPDTCKDANYFKTYDNRTSAEKSFWFVFRNYSERVDCSAGTDSFVDPFSIGVLPIYDDDIPNHKGVELLYFDDETGLELSSTGGAGMPPIGEVIIISAEENEIETQNGDTLTFIMFKGIFHAKLYEQNGTVHSIDNGDFAAYTLVGWR